jgi:Flp pilus assembly protein CpaB
VHAFGRSPRGYLLASVALALIAGLLLRSYLSQAARATAAVGPRVGVVVASQPIARGATVAAAALNVRPMPRAYAPPGSFSHIVQAAGRVALADLSPGEAVTETRLARVRAGPVASLVPEGLRAFAVPTSLPFGALAAGDHVDVLATYGSGQPHTETAAAGVEVLSVLGPSGMSGGGSAGTGGFGFDTAAAGGTKGITLIILVSPDQQEGLAFARAFADLEVTIAPPSGA